MNFVRIYLLIIEVILFRNALRVPIVSKRYVTKKLRKKYFLRSFCEYPPRPPTDNTQAAIECFSASSLSTKLARSTINNVCLLRCKRRQLNVVFLQEIRLTVLSDDSGI